MKGEPSEKSDFPNGTHLSSWVGGALLLNLHPVQGLLELCFSPSNSATNMLKISKRLKSTLHGRSFDAVVVGGGHNGLVAVSLCTLSIHWLTWSRSMN